jgi:hypothetical protein
MEGTVFQTSHLMRRFEMPVTPCTAHDLHAASSRQLQARHVSAVLHLHMARQMSMDFVSQEHGVPHDGPKDSNAGGYTREIEIATITWRRKPRDAEEHNAPQKGTSSFTQIQGPRGEVKPLFPAFLYYDAIAREEYKALVTKL